MRERFPALAAALWWGSLSVIGFVALPLLFAHLPSPATARYVAAQFIQAQTFISIACCACLFLVSKRKFAETEEEWARAAMVFMIGGLLLALLLQYGAVPRILARQGDAVWQSVGVVMYVLQWLCALAVLWRTVRR
ncbi:MAG: DUF4149 domain-containing protein [Comamonadaceae bacterium]|nr:MAG: DUF4149 domain-containing protein [Comamonadaceae bacterium]